MGSEAPEGRRGGANLRARWGACLLLAGLFAVVYGPSVGFELVWDDVSAIRDNALYKGPLGAGLVATQLDHLDTDLRKLVGVEHAHDSYRPLLYLSYRLDAELFGFAPSAMHVHNWLVAWLGIVACFLVARRWLDSWPWAFGVAALFALHPAQVESVVYVSARGDMWSGFCSLLATYSVWTAPGEGARRWLHGGLACLAFAASLFFKEAYIALPVAIGLALWSVDRWRGRLGMLFAMCATLAGYLVLRANVAGVGAGGGVVPAVLALPGIWLEYLRIVLLPFDLSTERLRDAAWVVPGWLALLACAGVGTVSLLGRGPAWLQATRVPIAGLAWAFLLVGPSALVVMEHGVIADRYLYLPLVGVLVAGAHGLRNLLASRPKLTPVLRGAGALWALMLLAIGWVQVGAWQSNHTLYAHATQMAPTSSNAWYRLGYALAMDGDCTTAAPLFSRAIELDDNNVLAYNNLGVCFMRLGRHDLAEGPLAQAARIRPGHHRSLYNLGITRIRLGNTQGGCEMLRRALAINPRYTAALEAAAQACAEQGGS